MSDPSLTEISTSEFRSFLSTPGTWVLGSLLGLLNWGLSAGLLHAHFFTETKIGLDTTQPMQVVFLGLMLLAWFVFGGWLLRSVALGILDSLGDTVQVLTITITWADPIRSWLSLHFRDGAGRERSVLVPLDWKVTQVPQEAELWRTRHGRQALRLRLRGEGRAYSVLDDKGQAGARR